MWVVLIGIAAFTLMLTNAISYMLKALQWQGAFVVAWVAVALVYLAFARRDRRQAEDFEFRPGRVPAFNIAGLVAWFGASATGIALVQAAGSFGATWSAPDPSWSRRRYAIGRLAIGERRIVLDRPFDPRSEVEDRWETRVRCSSCDRHYVAQEMDRNPATPDHAPICAECGSNDIGYLRASYAEARSGGAAVATPDLVVGGPHLQSEGAEP